MESSTREWLWDGKNNGYKRHYWDNWLNRDMESVIKSLYHGDVRGCVRVRACERESKQKQTWQNANIWVIWKKGVCVHAKSLQLCLTVCNPIDCSLPGSSVHGILGQENWSGLPCPPPGDLPNPAIILASLRLLHWQTGSLPLAPPERPRVKRT